MKRVTTTILGAGLALLSGLGTAYEIKTHARLSTIALDRWLEADPRGLERLGLPKSAIDEKQRFPNA